MKEGAKGIEYDKPKGGPEDKNKDGDMGATPGTGSAASHGEGTPLRNLGAGYIISKQGKVHIVVSDTDTRYGVRCLRTGKRYSIRCNNAQLRSGRWYENVADCENKNKSPCNRCQELL